MRHFSEVRYILRMTLEKEKFASVKHSFTSGVRFSPVFPAFLLVCLFLTSCSGGGPPIPGQNRSYSTSFPATENPISESRKWINGGMAGIDWGNVQTVPGLAFGTNVCAGPPYCDPTAVLTGTWGSNQMAQATVHTVNQNSHIYEELELRLRTTVAAHRITGYEINFRCTSDGSQYVQIVRWNGAEGKFAYVSKTTGPGMHDGDVVRAVATGDTIAVYVNGTQVLQGRDSKYMNGSPGIGFYNQGGTVGDNANYGFTSFMATDVM